MRSVAFVVAVSFGILFGPAARADILINVDKSAQRMTVSRDGQVLYNWPVSTGKPGYGTPSGSYTTFRMEADHFSKEWDDAPMPYSIFFTKIGHAIHGTYSKNIGTPVSHGCVRLSVDHARQLYDLVQQEGVLKTKVVLTGSEMIALKRGHTRLAEGEDDSPKAAPQYSQQYSQDDTTGSVEQRYADRRSGYGYQGYYGYGPRGDYYRPTPQYVQPQYQDQQPYDPYRSRYGIY